MKKESDHPNSTKINLSNRGTDDYVVTIRLPVGSCCFLGSGLTFLEDIFECFFEEEPDELTVSKRETQRHVALTTTDTGAAVKFSWKGSLITAAQRLGCKELLPSKLRHRDKYCSNSAAVSYKNVRGFIETLKEATIKEHWKRKGGGFECDCASL